MPTFFSGESATRVPNLPVHISHETDASYALVTGKNVPVFRRCGIKSDPLSIPFMSSPLYLIIAKDHVAGTESIQFYARSPYEAKKGLVKAALFETRRLSLATGSEKAAQTEPEFFGVTPEPELTVGQTDVFAIQGEAGNQNHSINIEQIKCIETGYVRTVPFHERTLLQTFCVQSVGAYNADNFKFDVPEVSEPDEEIDESDESDEDEEESIGTIHDHAD